MEIIICSFWAATNFQPTKPTLAFRVYDAYPSSINSKGKNLLKESDLYTNIKEYILDDTDTDTILESYPELNTPENWVEWKKEEPIIKGVTSTILRDFKKCYQQAECFLIHCTIGVSRSPAVAIALNEIFDLGEDSDFLKKKHPCYNKFIYRMLKETALEDI